MDKEKNVRGKDGVGGKKKESLIDWEINFE